MSIFRKRGTMKKTLIFLILAACLLTSCTDSGFDGVSDGNTVFTDALGRTVSVKKNPERVAALLGSFADIWITAGGKVCACPDDTWEDYGHTFTDAVNIGGAHSPNLELLLSADPDFVIASASTAADIGMKETLEALGITVAYFDVDNFYGYLDMLNICTDITGRKDLYEKYGLDVKAKIEQIKRSYALENGEHSVLLLRVTSSTVKAKGSKGTILGEMLSDMGCINVADSEKSLLDTLSVESVIVQNPKSIFVVAMGNDTEAAIRLYGSMIEQNRAWNTLDAVKDGRMYVMDRKLFNLKPNSRWAEAYEVLYETLTLG